MGIENKPSWLLIAEGELGVKEIFGTKHNPKIIEYHSITTVKATDDETSWCASFTGWCLEKAGIKSTKSAAARSYLNWGKKLDKPEIGCIVVFKRGTSPTQGHVGFYVGETEKFIMVLGGNQSDSVRISNYPKSDFLDYRWPENEPLC